METGKLNWLFDTARLSTWFTNFILGALTADCVLH